MTYNYKNHSITVNPWPTMTSLNNGWQAEVVIRRLEPKVAITLKTIRFKRFCNSKVDAEKYARTFVEKWIDDGKPAIQAGQLN
jgi:hypothetical protein